ncbi:hypothetical protein PVK06_035653 [Gossypium arboreum]|uniref:Uncharacterized protein n=1 Tax=Gossypium arboreum TaxID=29729 RepID=A0ABR0NHE0_GOSAR|nr:hypothetical protein PVK06_035653 [Gossypium arboreum]
MGLEEREGKRCLGGGVVFRRKGLRQQRGREEVLRGHENGSFGGKRGEIAKEEMEVLIVERKTHYHSNIMLAWLPAYFSLCRT